MALLIEASRCGTARSAADYTTVQGTGRSDADCTTVWGVARSAADHTTCQVAVRSSPDCTNTLAANCTSVSTGLGRAESTDDCASTQLCRSAADRTNSLARSGTGCAADCTPSLVRSITSITIGSSSSGEGLHCCF